MTNLRHRSKEISFYRNVLGSPFNWSSALKRRKRLGSAFLRMLFLIRGKVTQGWVGVCFVFASSCRSIYLHQGEGGLATHLKVCYVLLQKELGGDHLVDTTVLKARVARTRKGLPRIIPVVHRNEIRSGNQCVIRFWLTMFGLYRVLDAKRRINMDNISAPFSGSPTAMSSLVSFIPNFLTLLRSIHGGRDISLQSWDWRIEPQFITKSSPTGIVNDRSAAWPAKLSTVLAPQSEQPRRLDGKPRLDPASLDAFLYKGFPKVPKGTQNLTKDKISWPATVSSSNLDHDVGVWKHHPALWAKLMRWLELIGQHTLRSRCLRTWLKVDQASITELGRFGFKEEPGKIRVFAMVDYLTQVSLKPLHKVIFKILRPIRQDGTFDQMKPLRDLVDRCGNKQMWSFDLSAATDRLPLVVQRELLSKWLGEELAQLWASLLVDRSYYVPEYYQEEYRITYSYYKYAVGQPMGAYSSWGMLALTHHLIIQYCAHCVGRNNSWFSDYAVLGDDVVIADQAVAQEYLALMKGLGVGVGLEKSILQARGTCEFAKRFIFKGVNCSPLSFMAYGIAQSNLSVLDMLVLSAKELNPSLTLKAVLRFSGAGYKVLSRLPAVMDTKNRFCALLLFLTRPGGSFERPFLEWVFGTWSGILNFTSREYARAVGVLLKEEVTRLSNVKHSSDPTKSKFTTYDNLREFIYGRPDTGVSGWLTVGMQQQANALSMELMDRAVRLLLDWPYREKDPQGLLEQIAELTLISGQIKLAKTRLRDEAKAPNQTRLLKRLFYVRRGLRTNC